MPHTHRTKKMSAIKTFFIFEEEKRLQKFTPHPGWGGGVTLKCEKGTSIFYCRFATDIEILNFKAVTSSVG